LYLRCGDWVEVRSADEILATLDENAELDGLPFMPEMLRWCGKRVRVERSAHKTCDTITGKFMGLRLLRSVHLERARCDGASHGGCQANCSFFWKEAWLKRVEPAQPSLVTRLLAERPAPAANGAARGCTLERVNERTIDAQASAGGEKVFRCQATDLLEATAPLPWWEPVQYLRDWWSGNYRLGPMLRSMLLRTIYSFVLWWRGYRIKVHLYNLVARLLGDVPWPYAAGPERSRTPSERLDLQPGELVEVKSHAEILETLNVRMNRGMGFAPEMVKFCGNRYRVESRVEQIIDEKSGKMLRMKNDCITLADVVCASDCSENRLFCPRRIPVYWREIWLRRVEHPAAAEQRS
jgi:hypothetical protein